MNGRTKRGIFYFQKYLEMEQTMSALEETHPLFTNNKKFEQFKEVTKERNAKVNITLNFEGGQIK
jgi:hypothetical protein